MKYIQIIILTTFLNHIIAQNYAGPDTSVCASGNAIQIGNPSAPNEYCYVWRNADGLNESQKYSKTPTVNPNFPTHYDVDVIHPNFGQKETDRVFVDVKFGGIAFDKPFINPGTTSGNINATASLTINPGNVTIKWYITEQTISGITTYFTLDATTGCLIDENTGIITNCQNDGKLTVRARKESEPECNASASIDVNFGVKDIIASDLANPGRKAHSGQTLYIIKSTNNSATTVGSKFEAISNDGSPFPAGLPEFQTTGPVPFTHPGTNPWEKTMEDLGNYSVSHLLPNNSIERTVFVNVIGEDKQVNTYTLSLELISNFVEAIKSGKSIDLGNVQQFAFCAAPFGFSTSANPSAEVEKVKVGKYNDPLWGEKTTVKLKLPGAKIEGCVLFPCCTYPLELFGYGGSIYTYFGAGISIGADLKATKDPSNSNPNWQPELNISVTGEAKLGVRVQFLLGTLVGVLGEATLETSMKMTGIMNGSDIKGKIDLPGLEGKIAIAAYIGNPNNIYSKEFVQSFIPGQTFGPTTFYTVQN